MKQWSKMAPKSKKQKTKEDDGWGPPIKTPNLPTSAPPTPTPTPTPPPPPGNTAHFTTGPPSSPWETVAARPPTFYGNQHQPYSQPSSVPAVPKLPPTAPPATIVPSWGGQAKVGGAPSRPPPPPPQSQYPPNAHQPPGSTQYPQPSFGGSYPLGQALPTNRSPHPPHQPYPGHQPNSQYPPTYYGNQYQSYSQQWQQR